jgi:hypothetical protein
MVSQELVEFVSQNPVEKLTELVGKELEFNLLLHQHNAKITKVWREKDDVFLKIDRGGFDLKINLPKNLGSKEEEKSICSIMVNDQWRSMFIKGAKIIS